MTIPSTMKQMASGRMVDLAKLDWTDVDFAGDVAPALARLCRFDGAMTCLPYSVAQHCVLMADAAMDEYGEPMAAAACLLHDAHKAYIGEIVKPVNELVAHAFAAALCDDDIERFRMVLRRIKDRLDVPIFHAAAWPVPSQCSLRRAGHPEPISLSNIVHGLDVRMEQTERRHLLAPSETPWAIDAIDIKPIRMRGAIKPWPVAKAEMEWLDRLARFCPNHHRAAPPKIGRSA